MYDRVVMPAAGQEREELEDSTIRLVTFNYREEWFGVEITYVREVLLPPAVTRVPRVPPFVRGVINLRGEILAVLDLAKLFQFGEVRQSETIRIVVVESEEVTCGLLVDRVKKTVSVPESSIMPPPPTVADVGGEYMVGVVSQEGRPLSILNCEKIFQMEAIREL